MPTAGGDGSGGAAGKLAFEPAGLPGITLHTTGATTAAAAGAIGAGAVGGDETQASLAIPFDSSTSAAGFSTTTGPGGGAPTVGSLQRLVAVARMKEEALLDRTFGAARAGEGMAVKGAAMWTTIWTPGENAAPLMPVSRSWCKQGAPHGPYSGDFSYCIYDWDNSFATLLAACGAPAQPDGRLAGGEGESVSAATEDEAVAEEAGFALAVSNLIQTAKALTSAGFIPNNDGGGGKSEDRAEPPVLARVTVQMLAKFGVARMGWVLATVLDDLLEFNDWFFRTRLLPPLDLVALGGGGDMQCARYESGLDDSPMYDGRGSTGHEPNLGGDFVNQSCLLMELYDVGQSSLVVQDGLALATLAEAAGRPPALAAALRARAEGLAGRIAAHLWSGEHGVYANRFSGNGSFYPRISPTSFYAMAARVAVGETVIKCPSPLNVLKATYDHSCY
jgi:hypothetical protein